MVEDSLGAEMVKRVNKLILSCVPTSFYSFVLLLLSRHPGDASAELFHAGADSIHLTGETPEKKITVKNFTSKTNDFKVTHIDFPLPRYSQSENLMVWGRGLSTSNSQSATINNTSLCVELRER